jgi:hypothetical protein
MVRRRRVSAPAERLRERAVRVGGLPAADQAELIAQAIEELAAIAADGAWIARRTVADPHVEVAAEHQVGLAADAGDAVEDLVRRPDVAVLADGTVDAEEADGARRPARAPKLPADDPAAELRDVDGDDLGRAHEKTTSPACRSGRLPDESILFARTEALARALGRGPAFLAEDHVGRQASENARPVTRAFGAPAAEEVVRDEAERRAHLYHLLRRLTMVAISTRSSSRI